jgi:hypothetical protein
MNVKNVGISGNSDATPMAELGVIERNLAENKLGIKQVYVPFLANLLLVRKNR